ncbi:sugar phosphate isomerase/epimerase [Arthrobacter sp. AG258]|uniref:sugar phosphate isomerase/epimerase family protein n=1 Tax=Arthrobacter sp. AG258 TaxID=2183899 RepID=UPI00105F40D1|nr:sugar phosphate isomerase/epimerase family protein [Arthrobacter sp. AG258]TDT80156.1 sugar phosphate isomerase/epimerase [Arthrobacter sp. AG258]
MHHPAELEPTLTVSTLGAPGESLDTVLSWLVAHGARGVELRLGPGQIAAPAMTRRERSELRSRIEDSGLAVTGVASYIRVAEPIADELVVGALEAALILAHDLGAPAVRVFPGAPVHPCGYDRVPETIQARQEANALAAGRLTAVARFARDLGTYPALETHDSHPRGSDIAAILDMVDGPAGAVWDLMHPWRVGETLGETWRALQPWLTGGAGSVQVKDARLPASRTPAFVGTGTLPVDAFAGLLRDAGYAGPVCLEWEKAWHPDAPPLDEALGSAVRWFRRHWPARPGADTAAPFQPQPFPGDIMMEP